MVSKKTKHNKAVTRVAAGYKSQGYKVSADHVKGYRKPRMIYGKKPDVIATKGAKTRIVEVETRASLRKDSSQRNAFRRFANLSNKRRFRTKVI